MAPELFSSKLGPSKRAILENYLSINNLRQVQAAYDPRQSPVTLKLQLLIKAQKGVVVDTEALGRDSHTVSKQLFLWANEQTDERLKDVGDRLAFLDYQVGDLQHKYAASLERARTDLKQIRNMENELTKLREREIALDVQLEKLHIDARSKPDATQRLSAVAAEHFAVEQEMKQSEASVNFHKPRLLRSSYQTQFEAMREFGEKLSIISGYGSLLLNELDGDNQGEYDGKERTAWIKGAASMSLSGYEGPMIERPWIGRPPTCIGLSTASDQTVSSHRPDTSLFGETHPHVLGEATGNPSGSGSSHPDSRPHTNVSLSPQSHQVTSAGSPCGSMSPPHSANNQSAQLSPVVASQFSQLQDSSPGFESSTQCTKPPFGAPSGSGALTQHAAPVGPEPTVAEIGGSVPLGTNGPSTGTLPNKHHEDDELPAYSAISDRN